MKARNWLFLKADKVYLILTQNQKTVIDRDDLEKVRGYCWHAHRANKTFYARTAIYLAPRKVKSLYLHNLLCPDFKEVDHIDRNGLNNCRSNLRDGYKINAQNGSFRKDNTSGYRGVYWYKRENAWAAEIYYKSKQCRLGLFHDPAQAAKAYDAAVKDLFPPGAYLNFR